MNSSIDDWTFANNFFTRYFYFWSLKNVKKTHSRTLLHASHVQNTASVSQTLQVEWCMQLGRLSLETFLTWTTSNIDYNLTRDTSSRHHADIVYQRDDDTVSDRLHQWVSRLYRTSHTSHRRRRRRWQPTCVCVCSLELISTNHKQSLFLDAYHDLAGRGCWLFMLSCHAPYSPYIGLFMWPAIRVTYLKLTGVWFQ